MTKILIGTCGYSYNEWIGPVYPPGTKRDEFLPLYARLFNTVELDYSYYRMPTAEHLRKAAETGGPELTFSVKAHESPTHKVESGGWRDATAAYIAALEPLWEAGKLEAVLLQFPFSFHNDKPFELA
jgi:uncharacterized protein YecE (DUF72 family)